MRLAALVFLLLPSIVFAQPAPDQTGVANAFGRFVTSAHRDSALATAVLIACPVENDEGETVAGLCDPELAAHRARVEHLTTLATMLFSSEPTALNPHYAVEEERDGIFHLLLFSELDTADYVLAAFMDMAGAYRLVNLDTEGGPKAMPPPASVVDAFEQLVTAASRDTTTVDAFSALVVARGDDEDRERKAPADPAQADERRFVERALESTRTLMEASRGDYEIEGYESEKESEGEWHVLLVRFDTHEMEERRSFAFLLGDIDN